MEVSQHAQEPARGSAAAVAAEAIEAEAAAGTSILPDDLSPDEASEDELQGGAPADPPLEEARLPPSRGGQSGGGEGSPAAGALGTGAGEDPLGRGGGGTGSAAGPAGGGAAPVDTQRLTVGVGLHAFLNGASRERFLIVDCPKGTVSFEPKSLILVVGLHHLLDAQGDELSWADFAKCVMQHGRWVRLCDFQADAPTTKGVPRKVIFPAHTKVTATDKKAKPDNIKNVEEVALQVTRTRNTHTPAPAKTYMPIGHLG